MRHAAWISWACGAVLVLLLGSYAQDEWHAVAGNQWVSALGEDLAVYYTAGEVARRGGRLYYVDAKNPHPGAELLIGTIDPQTPWGDTARALGFRSSTSHYNYPPPFALFMAPLTALPFRTAFIIWRQLSTLSLLFSVYLVFRWLKVNPVFPLSVLTIPAALSFFPFTETLLLGQVGALILLLWTLGCYLADRNKPVLSALCFAVGTAIKLTPALVLPLFLLRGRWKWSLAYGGWLALIMIVSIWKLGWNNHATYFSEILPLLSCGSPRFDDKSFTSVIQTLYFGKTYDYLNVTLWRSPPPALCWFAKGIGLSLYGGVLAYFFSRNRRATHLSHEAAVIALVSLLVSPVSWRHHYTLALLPLLYLWITANPSLFSHTKGALLLFATAAIGTPFPHYLTVLVRPPVFQFPLATAMQLGALTLLTLGLLEYSRVTRPMNETQHGMSRAQPEASFV